MLTFILRRIGVSVVVLLGASLLMFVLTISSGDPLADLRESNAPNREVLMERRTAFMGLDLPWYVRYGDWLRGVAGCLRLDCDLGVTRTGTDVMGLLQQAASATLRLVVLSTVLALVIGVAVGILTSIRQYSGLDYAVTFGAFGAFSLPVFWVAALLKELGAIRFNDWVADPEVPAPVLVGVALGLGGLAQAVLGGDLRRRGLTAGATAAGVALVMVHLDAVDWYRRPGLGAGTVVVVGAGAAVLTVALVAGLRNRAVLLASLSTVAVLGAGYAALRDALRDPTVPSLVVCLAGALGVAVAVGAAVGGGSRRRAVLSCVVTALVVVMLVVVDQALSSWASFLEIKPRPIATIGAQTPNFSGTVWEEGLDRGAQLVLPTIVLTLVSVASYSRYTRSAMLEVLEQDYVRTARATGLPERTVIVKHAFRNALIPVTTIVAFDFAGLIGGAVIVEQVFGWQGMGELFRTGLDTVDPAPVMAFFLVTGVAAVGMNTLADLAYAVLDPRVRR